MTIARQPHVKNVQATKAKWNDSQIYGSLIPMTNSATPTMAAMPATIETLARPPTGLMSAICALLCGFFSLGMFHTFQLFRRQFSCRRVLAHLKCANVGDSRPRILRTELLEQRWMDKIRLALTIVETR